MESASGIGPSPFKLFLLLAAVFFAVHWLSSQPTKPMIYGPDAPIGNVSLPTLGGTAR